MTPDACHTCRRNDGSVKRVDILVQRAAIYALSEGTTTRFDRASAAYEAAIARRDAHRSTHQDAA